MDHWQLIKNQAQKFQLEDSQFSSLILGNPYKISRVIKDKIWIKKVDELDSERNRGFPFYISERITISALKRIEHLRFFEQKRLTTSVARGVAIITFHPFLQFNELNKTVQWNYLNLCSFREINKFIKDASDDELTKIWIEVNQRKYQDLFRQNLLFLYDKRCAISGVNVVEVLQASHISDHSNEGNNKSFNGILLRADLHLLFDQKLLLIHPQKLTVHLAPSLKMSIYNEFVNKKINVRVDKSEIDKTFLKNKWESVEWTKKII